ncbi:MAG: efflux RND transporter periplasmic adaptor subunit [Desulfobacteraceae bacterium]|nr:MAG: efflux RND transporter periplasmic adaptor subunit [Desulfobacteraceae bacterium]
MKYRRWLLYLVLPIGLFAFGAMHLYGGNDSPNPLSEKQQEMRGKDKSLPVVMVKTAAIGSVSRTMELTGTVTPTRRARIASPGEGPVETCEVQGCMVREGDRVTGGQVLLQIGRNQAAQAQLTAARQALKEQEIELQRVEQLVHGGAIAGSQLDTARSKFENARAQLSRALENHEDYSITAPWAGVVSKVHVAEGDYVTPHATLIEIFDPASLVVEFAVPEARSTDVRTGLPVRVQFDAHPGAILKGNISRVYPQLDERMRTRTVEAVLRDPVELIPGMFARIQVILARIDDAVTVPVEAVQITPNGEKVIFLFQAGKAVKRKVETGIEEAKQIQILKGIQSGDQVIVMGNEKLKDGSPVKAIEGKRS